MSNLFTETGEEILADLKETYETLSGVILKAANVIYMIFQVFAYRILLVQYKFNQSYQNMWLKYCDEDTLDLYAYDNNLTRITAVASRTTIKFTRISNITNEQSIPLGTRVIYNKIIFKTVDTYTFGVNETECEAIVECTETGTFSNDIPIGAITTILDPIPHVSKCENISITSGGNDLEDAEIFRERIRISPESYSTTGTAGAYKYWTKQADSSISDVYPYTKSAGVVGITILLENGVIPSTEMIEKVRAFVSKDEIRALNDYIVVEAPEEVEYSIDFDYYIPTSKEAYSISIQDAITEAIDTYVTEKSNTLGVSINPDEIIEIVRGLGAKRTVFRSPNYLKLEKNQVAKCINKNPSYAEVEDD